MPKKKEIQQVLDSFGANMRRERTKRGITQEKLAEAADLNTRTVQKIEAGQTNILITTMLRIRESIGCSFDRLFK